MGIVTRFTSTFARVAVSRFHRAWLLASLPVLGFACIPSDSEESKQDIVQDGTEDVGGENELEAIAAAESPLITCPANGLVAFSVSGGMNLAGGSHVSEGPITLLGYSTTYTNLGGGWGPGGGTFSVPCTGLYSFTVSFVKDSYYYNGTEEDVFVSIYKNGAYVGRAWSGQGTGARGTGSYTVTLYLYQGDYVQTYVGSDGDFKRHLIEYNFTGLLVRQ